MDNLPPFEIVTTMHNQHNSALPLQSDNPAMYGRLRTLLDPVRLNILNSQTFQRPLYDILKVIWETNQHNQDFMKLHPECPTLATVCDYYANHHPKINLMPNRSALWKWGVTPAGMDWSSECKINGSLVGAWISALNISQGLENPLGLSKDLIDSPELLSHMIVTAYGHGLLHGGLQFYGGGVISTNPEQFCKMKIGRGEAGLYWEERIIGGQVWGLWKKGCIGQWRNFLGFIVTRDGTVREGSGEELSEFLDFDEQDKFLVSPAFAKAIETLSPDRSYPLLKDYESGCKTWELEEGVVKCKMVELMVGVLSPDPLSPQTSPEKGTFDVTSTKHRAAEVA